MRGLRMCLICAAVGAVMVSAAAGAGTASAAATKLCKEDLATCPSGKEFPANSKFTVAGSSFTLSGITNCEFSYEFETQAISGSPLLAKIPSFTLTHCGAGYTVAPVTMGWEYQILATGGKPGGTAKMLPSLKFVGFEVNGNGETSCQYTTSAIPQSITGPGNVTVSSVPLTKLSGVGCVGSGVSVSMSGSSAPEFYVTN